MELVGVELEKTVASPSDAGWARARASFDAVEDDDEDIAAALAAGDADTLRAVLEDWKAGRRLMLRHDREVLKRAMKAFRKSLKVTRLDEESSLGGGAGGMSSGRHSSIVGIRPPERYPIEVWNELARQKRLVDAGHGLFELPPGG
jgi:hypothetical protein